MKKNWDELLLEAQGGKHKQHGRAIVRPMVPPKLPTRRKYTRGEWRRMSLAERVDALAERIGILENEK